MPGSPENRHRGEERLLHTRKNVSSRPLFRYRNLFTVITRQRHVEENSYTVVMVGKTYVTFTSTM